MPYARFKLDLAVCCVLVLGGVANLVWHWGSKPSREAPSVPPANSAATLRNWQDLVVHYGLREVPTGTVVTDRGRSVRAFARTRDAAIPSLEREPAIVRCHLQRADLIRLAPPSTDCDCHGWVFLGGRYWMLGEEVATVVEDNGYHLVESPQPADLVLYRDAAGLIHHSGVVVGISETGAALVESKWGDQGRYVHLAELRGYGRHLYYRSTRTGHRLRGLEAGDRTANPLNYASARSTGALR